MIIFISFIINVSFLFNVLSNIIINDDINKHNYTHDDVNHQNQYRQLSYFHHHRHHHHQQQHPHEQKQEQLESNRQLASSFDWKFYLAYNNDLQSAGINNELLGTNHYNLYGTLVYDRFYS